ncbi:MAG: tyrosine-type recombinase/integrase [Methylotenera sp.]|uniref:tyrosine-type recombinase/integrase n=1 Tax=Methylotenera sp. TaxID=2051956 RepID=UPI002736E8AC|nr:tyrosine-type recombinase/integrase [Methylotenera sp.]MDP2102110.1 tyrosine-type recombinase/integrase [Methylotenera sp.]MDP2281070.1 tyrosine-type recombinase/integrase [Methylotenera sp.]MDP3061165.1 tyrosine-type recombinase/integrase [Methylotenera sp.]MDP3210935.1 tyrosine-type recombinase/integrase [Methylotenera sp.]
MPVLKLTQDFINNSLHCPEGQSRIEFCDKEIPGLIIIVSATSSGGSFFLRYKNSTNKTSYIKISRTNEMTLADARKKAKLLKLEISNGADPSNEKRVQKAVPTLAVFYEDHYKPYAAVHKRSANSDNQLYKCRLESRFGHLRLNQITKTMIIGFHNELRESALAGATCDHYVKFLRHAFNLAIDWDMLKENPASGVKLFNLDNKVEHYLDATELETLMTVLKTGANRPVCMIAMFLLSTGARMNEVLSATWSQINIPTRTWKVPALNSKSKKVRSIPLNDSALAIISQLDTAAEFEYLFINRVTGNPYTNIHKAWGKIRNKAGLPQLRIHDLRHQYASFLVNSGRTLFEVQKILGHSNPSVTMRYSHLDSATLQAAANSASVMINAAMGGSAS